VRLCNVGARARVYVRDVILEKFKLYTLAVRVCTNDNATAGGVGLGPTTIGDRTRYRSGGDGGPGSAPK